MRLPALFRQLIVSAVFLLCFGTSFVRGEEVVRGNIRLVLHEDSGRFSLYRKDPKNGTDQALLFPKDPRTSVLSIAAGNLVYRMGESAGFSRSMHTTPSSGEFTWTSVGLRITQRFSLERREDPFPLEGVLIRIEIENRSDSPLPLGARVLLDTWLGEAEKSHFRTDTISRISGERRIPGSLAPAWWLSPEPAPEVRIGNNARESGLYVLSAGTGITPPDAIVFANWKRLRDSVWEYRILDGRRFGTSGFPVEDSAASVYYEPQPVDPGDVRTITVFLGVPASESLFSSPDSAGSDILAEIEALIRRIERLLAEGRVGPEEIDEIETRLLELKAQQRSSTGTGQ